MEPNGAAEPKFRKYEGKPAVNRSEVKESREEFSYEERITQAFTEDFVGYILDVKPIDYNAWIDSIRKYAENLSEVTSTQLRNIYTPIKQEEDPNKLALLRPRLAYISGKTMKRQEDQRQLLYLLDRLIVEVDSDKRLKAFQMFFECVIAYHKEEQRGKK